MNQENRSDTGDMPRRINFHSELKNFPCGELAPEREEIYDRLEHEAANTPINEIDRIGNVRVFIKDESQGPTGSTFDRLYHRLMYGAERVGYIVPGVTPLIECSTGNAGAAFARAARELGYHSTVLSLTTIPEQRKVQLRSYADEVVLLEGIGPSTYIQELERRLAEDRKNKGKLGEDRTRLFAITKIQINEPYILAPIVTEAYSQLKTLFGIEQIDCFCSSVGSGVTISSVGRTLKRFNPNATIYAVEHQTHQQISAFKRGEGVIAFQNGWFCSTSRFDGSPTWGVPTNKLSIDLDVIDNVLQVSDEEWHEQLKILHGRGTPINSTSAAVLAATKKLAMTLYEPKNFLILNTGAVWKDGVVLKLTSQLFDSF
jgi:cysteine synthase A